MSTQQAVTKTSTRVLTDEVRVSPVDEYLERRQARLLWLALSAVVVLVIIF